MQTQPVDQMTVENLSIVDALLHVAERLAQAQAALEAARVLYETRLISLSIKALDEPLFPDKGEELRPAKNDKERELAIKQLCYADRTMKKLRAAYKQAKREADLWYNRQRNYRLIAEMIVADDKPEY